MVNALLVTLPLVGVLGAIGFLHYYKNQIPKAMPYGTPVSYTFYTTSADLGYEGAENDMTSAAISNDDKIKVKMYGYSMGSDFDNETQSQQSLYLILWTRLSILSGKYKGKIIDRAGRFNDDQVVLKYFGNVTLNDNPSLNPNIYTPDPNADPSQDPGSGDSGTHVPIANVTNSDMYTNGDSTEKPHVFPPVSMLYSAMRVVTQRKTGYKL